MQQLCATIRMKKQLKVRKEDWYAIRLEKMLEEIKARVSKPSLQEGFEGIWLTPYAVDEENKTWTMPWLDVEHPDEHHKSIDENIKAAKSLYKKLQEQGLTHNIIIILTGKGFRFMWPFVVPPELKEPFLKFLKDNNFSEIDPSPQKTSTPFAILRYRGNIDQENSKYDVHTHMLENSQDILNLTQEEYIDIINGKPDPDEFIYWLQYICPQSFDLPEEWKSFLNEYKQIADIKSHIVQIGFSNSKKTMTDWEQINNELIEQGIKKQKKPIDGDTIFRLSECPSCGKSEGNPWLDKSGNLKCFRESCRANFDLSDPNTKSGLRPREWMKNYTGEKTIHSENTESNQNQYYSIESARNEIFENLESGKNMLIKCTPGVGKTYITLEKILQAGKHKLIYYLVPAHKNVEEVYAKVKQMTNEVNIRKIRGRKASDENTEATCHYLEYVVEISKKGFYPGHIACPECEDKNTCPYWYQFKNFPSNGLIITVHQKLGTLPKDPDIVVLDESVTQTMIENKEIKPSAMEHIKSELPSELSRNVLNEFHKEAEKILSHLKHYSENNQGRLYATAPEAEWSDQQTLWSQTGTEEYSDNFISDLQHFQQSENETYFELQRRLYSTEKIDYYALTWIKIAAGIIPGKAYIRITRSKNDPITYVYHRITAPQIEGQIIALDATGDCSELEALFPGKEFTKVNAKVPAQGQKIQITYSLGKRAVCGGYNSRDKPMEYRHILSKLNEGLKWLKSHEQKVLIVTHQAAIEPVHTAARELDPHREFQITNFWGNRGQNHFEDCQAVICFGTPSPNPQGVKDFSAALFSSPEAQKEWIASLGIKDLFQSIHRVRPIYDPKSIIVLGRHWPDDLGPPDRRITKYQSGGSLSAAAERLRPVARNLGFMNRGLACLFGVFCGDDNKQMEGWMDVHESLVKFFLFPMNILSGNEKKSPLPLDPIQIKGADAWSKLIEILHEELDLPFVIEKNIGPGRPSKAIGFIKSFQKFYEETNLPYSEECWKYAS